MNYKASYAANPVLPSGGSSGSVNLPARLDVVAGTQFGVHVEPLPERFIVGINRDDAEYSLFSAEDVSVLIEFGSDGDSRFNVRVLDGDVSLDGDHILAGHHKSARLPFEVSVADIVFRIRKEDVALPPERIVSSDLDVVAPTVNASSSSGRSGLKIVVACLFGAVAANHQFGMAFTAQGPSAVVRDLGALTVAHRDASIEFIQRAQYLGLHELLLRPHTENPRTVNSAGYVRTRSEVESLRTLATQLGVSFVSNVSVVQELLTDLNSALVAKRLSARAEYLGGGRFQVASTRSELITVKAVLANVLSREKAISSVSLLIADSHRSSEREVGVELTASNLVSVKTDVLESEATHTASLDASEAGVATSAKRFDGRRGQFSSVLLANGHRVYGAKAARPSVQPNESMVAQQK
jgi:hypothetical protein